MNLRTVTQLGIALLTAMSGTVWAETVKVSLDAVETDLIIDNAGNKQSMWTYSGTVPGPVIRVTEGDVVEFTLHNSADNEQSHSIDFHAAIVDVLDEFASVNPGEQKSFTFAANHPGVFIYHCGSDSMAEHISRGMYGVIIVDPAAGYSETFPRPDREYVLVQGDLFAEGTSAEDRAMGKDWTNALVNGKVFHYDPVHDSNASLTLEAEPGERVRIFFVNAMINEAAAFHPIAGIWERVWDNGNPKNVRYGLQTVEVPPAHGMVFDLVPPADRPTNNALVDHRMRHALRGAITVLMTYEGVAPEKGKSELIIR
ncbi:MAG: multicopper oxidase domain-containing protein [Pseudomonadales bacterium]|nr:multicopper oxidase domain-containing protein [Pseudomonadales bacterium]